MWYIAYANNRHEELLPPLERKSFPAQWCKEIFNPRHTCAAKVTVLGLCVHLSAVAYELIVKEGA